MKHFLVCLGIVLGLAAAAWSQGRAQAPERERNAFMRLKLQNTQDVLNGIAIADFDRIETGAESLVRLSKKAEFQHLTTREYERYSNEFRQNAVALQQAGKDRNIDRATLAYVQLTLNCVNCHKHLRAVQ